VRHLAWLQATPEKKGSEKPETRWTILKNRGSDLTTFPPVETDKHILEWLFELGVFQPSGYGPMPISFQEIESWARMTRTVLTWQESKFLKELSQEYCNQYAKSSDRNAAPPYTTEKIDKESVSDRVRNALLSHNKRKRAD